jgi:hypothetical protein
MESSYLNPCDGIDDIIQTWSEDQNLSDPLESLLTLNFNFLKATSEDVHTITNGIDDIR